MDGGRQKVREKVERGRTAGHQPSTRRRAPTPIPITRRTRTVIVVLCFLLLAYLMWASPAVPATVLGGFSVAVALSFPVRWLQRLMPRGWAILTTFLLLAGAVTLGIVFLVPVLIDQLVSFVSSVPEIARAASETLQEMLRPLEERGLLEATPEALMQRFGGDLLDIARNLAEQVLGGLVGFVSGTFNLVLGLFGVLFVAVYFLINVRGLKASYLRAAPKRYRFDAGELWDDFAFSLSRYLSGLVFVMFVQGAISAVGLIILGVPYALLLGAWVSITAVIPYLGAWLGAIPAVIVALTESGTDAILTGVLFLAIQQLEGNVLTPRIQGQTLNLPSILVFLVVIAGGQIGGLVGVIFAVPALAVVKVLFDFFRVRLKTT